MEQNDVSDRTIVVLVVLAVVVSILGTWTVLSSVNGMEGPVRVVDMSGSDTSGQIQMKIVNKNMPTTGQVARDTYSGAQISLTIDKKV